MKLVTFNIRCDYGQDGNNCFPHRKELILKKTALEKPDIVCFQEVLPHVHEWLCTSLSDYITVGCGREAGLGGEHMSTAFRKDRFQMISMETFWLSQTPRVPGSRFADQSECPRTVTEVFLQELASKRYYLIFNTHLDHIGSRARVLGMGQVLASIRNSLAEKKPFGAAEAVLAGDFNAHPADDEIRMMEESGIVRDISDPAEGTFHDYGRQVPAEKIDYIAVTPGIACSGVTLWRDCENGVYLSDHYPICAEIF